MNDIKSAALYFDKFEITRDSSDNTKYFVDRFCSDGTIERLEDQEKDRILDGTDVAGSIAYSCDDERLPMIVHLICRIAQWVHKWLTGHADTTDSNVIHGFIIVGKGNETDKEKYNTRNCDPTFDGVLLHESTYIKYKGVSRVLIYRPKDPELRNRIQDLAIKIAFPKRAGQDVQEPDIKKWKYHVEGCNTNPNLITKFSYIDLILSPWFNSANFVSEPSEVSEDVVNRIAHNLTDAMLEKFLMKDENGIQKSWFCSAFVTTIFQICIYMNDLDSVIKSNPDALIKFKQDENGINLTRNQLFEKIRNAMIEQESEKLDPIGQQIHETFAGKEFARVDGKYFMSGRFVELADSLSYQLPPNIVQ